MITLLADLKEHAHGTHDGICRVKPDVLFALIECAESLHDTIALSICHATTYKSDNKLDDFHPIHTRILDKACNAIDRLELL